MKKILLVSIGIILSIMGFAQPPQAFNYQTVIRDGAGDVLQNQAVNLRMNIHQGSAVGTIIFQETHSDTTNEFGLVSIEIGKGTPVTGTLSGIDWGDDNFYLETELDPAGGSNYVSMGTTQLLSVPFALYAETSGDAHWENVGDDISYNNGNVGIGTTSPDSKLEVAGTIHSSAGGIQFPDGTTQLTANEGSGWQYTPVIAYGIDDQWAGGAIQSNGDLFLWEGSIGSISNTKDWDTRVITGPFLTVSISTGTNESSNYGYFGGIALKSNGDLFIFEWDANSLSGSTWETKTVPGPFN